MVLKDPYVYTSSTDQYMEVWNEAGAALFALLSLYLVDIHGRCAVGHKHMVDRMLGWFGVCVRAAQNCVLCCGEVLLLVLN